MADEPAKFDIIDNPSVAESYANKLIAASFDGGAVVITVGATRFVLAQSADMPKEGSHPAVIVTARLALAPAGAVALNKLINTLIQEHAHPSSKDSAAAAKPT